MKPNGGGPEGPLGRIAGSLAVLIGVALLVVCVVITPDSLTGRISYLVVTGGAGAAAYLGARQATAHRRIATLIAAGVSCSFLGDLAFELLDGPDLSVADVGYLAAYVAVGAALLLVIREHGTRIDLDGCIDIAAVFVVAMVVQWELGLEQVVSDTSSTLFARSVWALYPTGDAVLLALVVRAAMSRRVRGRATALLAAGAACWLFSDFAYTVPAFQTSLAAWLDLGWLVGAMLLGSAPWAMRGDRDDDDTRAVEERETTIGYGRLAIAVLPLPLPALLAVANDLAGTRMNPAVLFGSTITFLGVATARAIRLLQVASEARARLRSQKRYASALAANASDAVAVLDADGNICNDSSALGAMVGDPEDTTAGWNLLRFVHPDDAGLAGSVFARSLGSPGVPLELEVRVRNAPEDDGLPHRWVAARVTNLLDDPDVRGIVVNLQDVTARKRAEEEITHQAFHDALTGLANRSLFSNRVDHAVGRTPRTGRVPAVMFIDLDGFKAVNDTLGHGAGDILLTTIADRLGHAVRDGDTVARLGGDEFAILLEESFRTLEDATRIADRALEAIAEPIFLGGKTVQVSGSIGIAIGDETATGSSLLRDADMAMYESKAAGKARWTLYDPVMRAAALERIELETDLVGAIERQELRLAFQPVVALGTGDVVGFESLLRWHHPRLGVVAPDRFIPLAEEDGLIVPIGRWVLREAARIAAEWQRDLPAADRPSVSVNISGRHVVDGDLTVDVAEALATSGLEPSRLFIEITETALVEDMETAAARLDEVRALGVRIAIDDFGTGYSSLAYLRSLPIDVLKIDRSFIGAIDGDEVPAMVRGLIDLGRTLGLITVAEGVELDSQRQLLHDAQCSYAQGYLFAKPMEAREVELLLLQRAAVSP